MKLSHEEVEAIDKKLDYADESLKKGFPEFDWKTGLRFMSHTKKQKIED